VRRQQSETEERVQRAGALAMGTEPCVF